MKLHNLYAVHGTPLGEQVLSGEVKLMDRRDYVETIVEFLRLIPSQVVVERVSGDAPPDYLIGPLWCLEKSVLRKEIEDEFERLDAWQGDRYQPSWQDKPEPYATTPESIAAKISTRSRLPVLRIADERA